jgi:hypothetical protein
MKTGRGRPKGTTKWNQELLLALAITHECLRTEYPSISDTEAASVLSEASKDAAEIDRDPGFWRLISAVGESDSLRKRIPEARRLLLREFPGCRHMPLEEAIKNAGQKNHAKARLATERGEKALVRLLTEMCQELATNPQLLLYLIRKLKLIESEIARELVLEVGKLILEYLGQDNIAQAP